MFLCDGAFVAQTNGKALGSRGQKWALDFSLETPYSGEPINEEVHMKVTKYGIKLVLKRDMLGTNPCNPKVLDEHVIQKQRKIVLEKNKTNVELSKYLDQLAISKERGEEEVSRLFDKLEALLGVELTKEDREKAMAGDIEALFETCAEVELRGVTVFLHDKKTGRPCIGDHMIYGFMKAASEALIRADDKTGESRGVVLKSIAYTKSIINQFVRCEEQFIVFDRDVRRGKDGAPSYLQRSLRAMTAQGPRISLAKSEVIEAGASLSFTLKVLGPSDGEVHSKYLSESAIREIFSYGELTGLGQWRNAGNGMFIAEIIKL